MSDILVKAAATLHEAWVNRKELAGAIRRRWKKAKSKLRRFWRRAQMPVLAGAICLCLCTISYRAGASSPFPAAVEITTAPDAAEPATMPEPLRAQIGPAAASKTVDEDARELARVLYGLCPNHPREAQEAACWCVINRVESSLYPDSVAGVCRQPAQWMGYAEDAPVVQGLYDTAHDVLEIWRADGIRPVPPGYLWLEWSPDEIVLRDSYEIGSRTHEWRAG